ncbi:MAG: RES family NAD+ phosphorylase [Candidatus Obscuribacterales bacterium]|nr:RES family NAD+ phosphorylase [Steroidobacteraceae bacterium]
MSAVAYRLVKKRHAKEAFSGEGARIAGGRWNSPGIGVVYVSETLSLAALETFVHLQPVDRHYDYVWFRIAISKDVSIDSVATLPTSWRRKPPTDATQAIGTRWVQASRTAVLRVPSILVPGEYNFLLNPTHPNFKRLKISRAATFDFDARLWKGGVDK